MKICKKRKKERTKEGGRKPAVDNEGIKRDNPKQEKDERAIMPARTLSLKERKKQQRLTTKLVLLRCQQKNTRTVSL